MNATQMVKAAPTDHAEDYIIARAYAQGRKDGGANVDPKMFARSYVNALRSWEEAESGHRTKRWIGVEAFFNRYIRTGK